jgi:lipoprotein NlpD
MRHNYLFSFLFTLLLVACSSPYQAPIDEAGDGPLYLDSGRTHLVNSGETLYVIAWMYDLDFSALARANNLSEPYAVSPGQVLRVDLRGQPTAPAAAAPQVVSRGATVTTSAVQTAGAIQRTPLPGSGITRRELPSSGRSTAPPPVEPSIPPVAPAGIPERSVSPATVPVVPPVATIEAPRTSPAPIELPPVQTEPPVPTSPSVGSDAPVQTIPSIDPTPPAQAPVVVPPPVTAPVAPATAAAEDAVDWAWPFRGAVIGRFGDAGVENKGLDLAGNKGDSILAAADGEVVYSGSGLLRYGDLIIIKHNEHFLSAYAHNSALNVREGDKVKQGQKIAELGSSGINRNMLHFEIRLDGKPVDPQLYLPAP